MANQEQIEILQRGALHWNRWRKANARKAIDLREAQLSGVNLREVDLAEANLQLATLGGVDLQKADLANADLRGAFLIDCNLSDANISASNLRQGFFSAVDFRRCNLKGADLTLADFPLSFFIGNDLSGFDLRDADLSHAQFIDANLHQADLSSTDLSGAVFIRTDLTEANLENANLSAAKVGNSNFGRSRLGGTSFAHNDLSKAVGLDTVEHLAPSSIGVDTLLLSRGKIPDEFLRGCGLVDWEIESAKLYDPDLSNEDLVSILYRINEIRANQPLQISPLFISYSHADHEFVDKLGRLLSQNHIRFWRDIHHATPGPLETQVDRAIRQNPTLLLVLSENSMASDWVQHEVREARKLGQETGRNVLCPIALDKSWKNSQWPKRIMEQIKEYYVADFSDWRDDEQFSKLATRLLDGLNLWYRK